jgi:hypothetical protein
MSDQPWPLDWMPTFLLVFRNNANVKASCESAGISRVMAYKARKKYAGFRDAWDEALEDAVDMLEAAAWKRAQETSDFLLWRLLASLRREKYADKIDVTINIQQQAAELAEKYGLDAKEIVSMAEEIVSGAKRAQ